MKKYIKAGFSEFGGIYIGENVQTQQHLFHALTIAVSFSNPFELTCEQDKINTLGVLIQPHSSYNNSECFTCIYSYRSFFSTRA